MSTHLHTHAHTLAYNRPLSRAHTHVPLRVARCCLWEQCQAPRGASWYRGKWVKGKVPSLIFEVTTALLLCNGPAAGPDRGQLLSQATPHRAPVEHRADRWLKFPPPCQGICGACWPPCLVHVVTAAYFSLPHTGVTTSNTAST